MTDDNVEVTRCGECDELIDGEPCWYYGDTYCRGCLEG